MCMSSIDSWTQDISVAGTRAIPSSTAAALASPSPSIASWSVSARVVTPAFAAAATTAAGGSSPSETVEWLWRSSIGGAAYEDQRKGRLRGPRRGRDGGRRRRAGEGGEA